jgi:hypothetical protein
MAEFPTYVQFGQDKSQVFVFMSPGTDFMPTPHLVCALCFLGDVSKGWEHRATNTQCMVQHLLDHTAEGHHVPGYVITELLADDLENFPDDPH